MAEERFFPYTFPVNFNLTAMEDSRFKGVPPWAITTITFAGGDGLDEPLRRYRSWQQGIIDESEYEDIL